MTASNNKEFLAFNKLENNVVSFDNYLQIGGMPEYVKNRMASILIQLVDDILHRDIAMLNVFKFAGRLMI